MNLEMTADLRQIAKEIRKNIVRMHAQSGSSHIASSLSPVEILVVLYFRILKINPKNPDEQDRDRFILSKGHSSTALYAVLSLRGFFPENVLDEYYTDGGRLPGHSTMHCVPGVEVSTGALGHGLPMGVGMALAGKCDKRDYRVFVLVSDGECDEGSIWESAMFARHHNLDNLIVIVDYNKLQAFGRTNDVLNLEPFKDKWASFGWSVKEIDGHNFLQIERVLSKLPFEKGKPNLVIAHTIKGKGISFMEDRLEWHYKSPNIEQLDIALKELD
ncbi:MAG: transketolase [Candidatus Odinarchaeia archaeon]